MLYGFSGASRCGKTTLAKRIADDLGIEFMPIRTTDTAKRYGFDPVRPMPLLKRMELQMILYEDFMQLIEKAPRPLIVDRTPLDHIAYLLSEIHMQSGLEVDDAALNKCQEFVALALDSVAKYFDFVFYLEPLQTYAAEPDKAPSNRLYHYHYSMVMQGLLASPPAYFNRASVQISDFEHRVETVSEMLIDRMNAMSKQRNSSLHIH